MNPIARRISHVFLCALPFIAVGVVGVRALRVPGLHEALGVVLLAAVGTSAWLLGARTIGAGPLTERKAALAGLLLVLPWAVISLLWVGLGAPHQATTPENHMRFIVLLASTLLVAGAFVVLKEALHEAGERFYSTLGFAASIPAGTAYLVAIAMSAASTLSALSATGASSSRLSPELYSVLEWFACMLTYAATAAFASSLARVGWLGRAASRGFVIACAVLVALLVARGLSYPSLSEESTPWYLQATFIARIPAVPWIMPFLLGVALLRWAGRDRLAGTPAPAVAR